MKPNYALVESIAADGRIYVAVGMFAALVALIGVAWWLGVMERRDSRRDGGQR